MTMVERDWGRLYYETAGNGDPVALVGDVGFGAWQWGWQYRAVAGPFESVVPETRGAGRSDAPPGPYSLDDLVDDLDAVLADRGARRVHLVGAGLGGAVALRYAFDSGRVRSLALVGTAASGEAFDLDRLRASPDDRDALRESTLAALSESFAAEQPDVVDDVVEWRAAEDAPLDAWDAQAGAVDGFDRSGSLYEVTVPALVIYGTADAVCDPAAAEALAEGLPRGEALPLDGAGHLAGVERSRAVNDALVGHLESAANR